MACHARLAPSPPSNVPVAFRALRPCVRVTPRLVRSHVLPPSLADPLPTHERLILFPSVAPLRPLPSTSCAKSRIAAESCGPPSHPRTVNFLQNGNAHVGLLLPLGITFYSSLTPLETFTVFPSELNKVQVSNGVTARSERCVERAVALPRLNVNPRNHRFFIIPYPFVLSNTPTKYRSPHIAATARGFALFVPCALQRYY